MPDTLDENGLVIKTLTEIEDELKEGYRKIYGDDIDLGSNTSDGQLIGIYAQAARDLRELIQEVYNSCNPDFCRGVVQDIRFKINNLTRKGGSFSIIPMTVVVTGTTTLQGLDADYSDPTATAYGATDNSGAKFYLIDTTTVTVGTHVLPFRAAEMGPINPIVGTITNPIIIKKEISSLINDTAPTSIGTLQGEDEAFALRRERSTETHAQNNVDAIRSKLLELDGVTDAYCYSHDYENYPDSIDGDGIPVGYIWPIVEGGANADIGDVLYANCGGAGMKGEVSVQTPTSSGQMFTSKFDRSEGVPLYISFDLQETVAGTEFDFDGIKSYIAENLKYSINEYAETSKVNEVVALSITANGGNAVGVNVKISTDDEDYKDFIPCSSKKSVFTIDASRIKITEINL